MLEQIPANVTYCGTMRDGDKALGGGGGGDYWLVYVTDHVYQKTYKLVSDMFIPANIISPPFI